MRPTCHQPEHALSLSSHIPLHIYNSPLQSLHSTPRNLFTHTKSLTSYLTHLLHLAPLPNVRVCGVARLERSNPRRYETAFCVSTGPWVLACTRCEDGGLNLRQVLGRGEEDEFVAVGGHRVVEASSGVCEDEVWWLADCGDDATTDWIANHEANCIREAARDKLLSRIGVSSVEASAWVARVFAMFGFVHQLARQHKVIFVILRVAIGSWDYTCASCIITRKGSLILDVSLQNDVAACPAIRVFPVRRVPTSLALRWQVKQWNKMTLERSTESIACGSFQVR